MGQTLNVDKIVFDFADTLDVYDQGTWTPTVIGTGTVGTATYTTQYGWYVRLGNLVFYGFQLDYTAGTGTGNLRVEGLPFTVDAASPAHVGTLSVANTITIDAAANQIFQFALQGTTNLQLNWIDFNTANAAIVYDAAGSFGGQGMYLTS